MFGQLYVGTKHHCRPCGAVTFNLETLKPLRPDNTLFQTLLELNNVSCVVRTSISMRMISEA